MAEGDDDDDCLLFVLLLDDEDGVVAVDVDTVLGGGGGEGGLYRFIFAGGTYLGCRNLEESMLLLLLLLLLPLTTADFDLVSLTGGELLLLLLLFLFFLVFIHQLLLLLLLLSILVSVDKTILGGAVTADSGVAVAIVVSVLAHDVFLLLLRLLFLTKQADGAPEEKLDAILSTVYCTVLLFSASVNHELTFLLCHLCKQLIQKSVVA